MSGAGKDAAIAVEGMHHRYGTTVAVDGLDLHVAAGEVVGLLGHNGAGKTTTLTSLMGLRRPQAGSLSVLGLDSWKEGVAIRSRVGYVPEDLSFHDWMTVEQTLWFLSQFYPTWDAGLQADLVSRLELPLSAKVGALSRGMRAKLALACATTFRPEALVLDDPTSGIDPLVRREFLAEVIQVAADGGKAVLFSSHLLDDVERLADRVLFVVNGRKVLDRDVAELKGSMRRVVMSSPGKLPEWTAADGVLKQTVEGERAELIVDSWPVTRERLTDSGATLTEVSELDLEDIFVEVVTAAKKARKQEGR